MPSTSSLYISKSRQRVRAGQTFSLYTSKSRQGLRAGPAFSEEALLVLVTNLCILQGQTSRWGARVAESIRPLAWYKHRKSHSFMREEEGGKHSHI